MKIRIGAFFLGLQFLSCFAQEPTELESVKQKFHAQEADPVIRKMAEEALRNCGITEAVIILQRNHHTNSYTYLPAGSSQVYFALSVANKTLGQIESNIYHEIGHLSFGDVSRDRKKKEAFVANGWHLAAGLMALGLYQYMPLSSPWFRGPFACLGILGGLTVGGFHLNSRNAYREERADIFAYKKLLEHGKLTILLEQVFDYLENHQNGKEGLPRFLSRYPSDLDRARCGVQVLQQARYSIADLLKNLPEDLDPGIKQHLPELINRYCPEMAS